MYELMKSFPGIPPSVWMQEENMEVQALLVIEDEVKKYTEQKAKLDEKEIKKKTKKGRKRG